VSYLILSQTWRDPGMLTEIERHIKAAGFGRRANERVLVSLTEAEAAAVYALKSGMTTGETFIVCDAGGGTSDVNVLRVSSTGTMELDALSYTEGRAVGSTLIDFKAKKLIEGRLQLVREYIGGDIEGTAEQMLRDEFQSFKCNFGSEEYTAYPRLTLPVPRLRPGQDFPAARIHDSNLVITR
jgi:molecular chaperone DnaK (HSP70)